MNTVALFLYGTLRPGDYNHDRFPNGVVDIINGCTTQGKLYHAFPGRGRVYPGARFDEDGTIIGDILFYDIESDDLRFIVSMEIGAGYVARDIKVVTPDRGTIEAVGFHYDRSHGALIESGDWFAEDAYIADNDLTRFAEDEYGEDWGDDEWYDDDED